MTPQPVNLRELSDDQAARFSAFFNLMGAESAPNDPPVSLEEHLRAWRNPSPKAWYKAFVVLDGETVVGYADSGWDKSDEENPTMCWSEVLVAPSHRRRGIGRALLLALLETAHADGKLVSLAATNEGAYAGEAFVALTVAQMGLREHTNQLLFSEMNRAYVERSVQKAPAEHFELGWYENEYPDSELEALCALFEVMNTAPRGKLEINDRKVRPEDIKIKNEHMRKNGVQWWMLYARDRATGRYAGYTRTGYHANRPHLVEQWSTAVHPDFRGHGLGAWLKSMMIDRILRERPTVDRIRTGNADSNEPMLKINHALGFKPFISRKEWQVDIPATLEKLSALETSRVR
jgi:GNAT superfamily N-acetyltransferase